MNNQVTCVCFILLSCIHLSTSTAQNKKDVFHEELLLKPLYTEQLYAHFQFSIRRDVDIFKEPFLHTEIFPRSLGEIIKRFDVQELHISLTAGLWRYESWGYPVIDAAPGAELWVWFKPNTLDIDSKWRELSSTLSGLLCASLNFVDNSNTISPELSLRPSGVVRNGKFNSSNIRYATLPREIVCTENLTPWKKLLPCDYKSGLASLLNSGYIHNTRYHSLTLHFRPVCRDKACKLSSVELQQTVELVYDYGILGTKDWSFKKLFGQGIVKVCPLASSSVVYVDTSSNSSVPYRLNPEPDSYLTSTRGGHTTTFAKYDVTKGFTSLSASYSDNSYINRLYPPPIYATQYVSGYGQEYGGLVTKIFNNHWNSLNVVLLQNIPWYIPIFLHTLKISIDNNEDLQPLALKYVPGKARMKPYHLEVALIVPPKCVVSISVEFDYVFLKWQEYPPDANHGFYIGSAVISSLLPVARNYSGLPQDGSTIADTFNASRNGYLVQVRTENLLITLPTPDFSMPYNVICLACTVVALAFGPLHNITTKRLILKIKDNEKVLAKLKRKLLGLVKRGEEECE